MKPLFYLVCVKLYVVCLKQFHIHIVLLVLIIVRCWNPSFPSKACSCGNMKLVNNQLTCNCPACFLLKPQFPNAHVRLYPLTTAPKVLKGFTLDFDFEQFVATTRPFIFSFHNNKVDNALLVGFDSFFTLQKEYTFPTTFNPGVGIATRMTVTVGGNELKIYIDTKLRLTKIISFQATATDGYWLIGQDQDKFGGGFNEDQRFVGKVCNLRMWSSYKSMSWLKRLFQNDASVEPADVFDSPPTYAFKKVNF